MSKKICFLYFAFLIFTKGFSQDPMFSNTQQSLVYLNPSFTGSNGLIRNQFVYRNQWPNLTGSYVTFYNGTEVYLKRLKGALAFTYLHDDQARGILKSNVFSCIYAQHFSSKDNKLKIIPSIKASYFNKKLDRTQLSFGEQIDPRRGFVWSTQEAVPSQTKRNFDVSSGLLINYNHFYFGASVFHINQPDEGLLGTSILPARFSFHSSYNLHVSEKTLFHFFGRYEMQQKFYFYQFSATALLFKHLIFGLGIINNTTPTANLGFRHNYFTVQVNYGVTSSLLSTYRAETWELTASFNLRNKEQRKTLTDFEKW
ncbi:MAG: PorP/SprF family type IX secretion system membrane protein [Bacteroidota bacterium]|nr:PorP/SprF family type IX secretion system membrane protein [Bacteroidota bacterium]